MRGKRLTQEQLRAIQSFRLKGWSLNEISSELSLSKSTVFFYIKDIVVPEKILKEKAKIGGSTKIRIQKEKEALEYAQTTLRNLSFREKLLILVSLYWAEGSKKDFGLSNTDPKLISVYVQLLRELFYVEDKQLRVSLRIYEDLNQEECLQFWSNIVKIPKESFISVNVLTGRKKGKLLYGMCRIRVAKAERFLKRVKAMYSVLGEKIVPIA